MSEERNEPAPRPEPTGPDDSWIRLSLEVSRELLNRTRECAESIMERVRRLIPDVPSEGNAG